VTDLNADDIIFVGVEVGFAAKRVTADFILFDAGRRIGEHALAEVNQDVVELRCFGELTAACYAQDESPAAVILGHGGRVGMVQSSVQTSPLLPVWRSTDTVTRIAALKRVGVLFPHTPYLLENNLLLT
jgi:hypothetical protein